MTTKAPVLGGAALLALALVALGGADDEPRGGVLLNPDPPEAPRWGLEWEPWERPGATAAGAASAAANPAAAPEAPAWDADAPAGIWATPAQFADSD